MKLKTLNEIGNQDDNILWAIKNVIREEAIKWVKELEDFTSVTFGEADHDAEMIAAEFLRKFFNITEEDLNAK